MYTEKQNGFYYDAFRHATTVVLKSWGMPDNIRIALLRQLNSGVLSPQQVIGMANEHEMSVGFIRSLEINLGINV